MGVHGGCSEVPALVTAPNLYADSDANPYVNVPPELQSTNATVVYATDRTPESIDGVYGYGATRSRITSYGVCTVGMGKPGTTWDELVTASTKHPSKSNPSIGPIPLSLTSIRERGYYSGIGSMVEADGKWVDDPAYLDAKARDTEQLHQLLAEQLAKTPRKELFVFVHGYNNSFAWGAFRASQIWHFCGRGGVPVLYSWPAGSTGLLQGYTRDRESSEFTVPHFKLFLKALASCPEVKKINLIGHSRGTDVVLSTLRELQIECRAADKSTQSEYKLGQVILAAPDIDIDVAIEKVSADRVGFVPEQFTMYVSRNDKAIGLATWLFNSAERLGKLNFGDLSSEIQTSIKSHPVLSIVEVRAKTDRTGHGYFLSSPAALSDVILVLRDNDRPGAANGRPLVDDPEGFWELYDGYPFQNVDTSKAK